MSEWISVADRLPERNGEYLVATKMFGRRMVLTVSFATDLYEIEKRNFPEHGPGWYKFSDMRGFYEWEGVTHWMPLPDLPEEGNG